MKNTARTYERLVEFEERAASLYLLFARRFTDQKDLSWFWLQMGMEERQHALLLEFCGCEELIADGLPDRNTIQKLSSLFRRLEERAGAKELSADDAFLIAAELEASEINDIYSRVIRPIRGTGSIMRKKIETLIPDHMQTLIRGARKFGVSAATVARLVETKRRDT